MAHFQLKLKSFDFYALQQNIQFLEILLIFLHIKNYKKIPLPTKIKKFTVLRSPHIDKKSREQFQMKRYKYIFAVSLLDSQLAFLFLELLKNSQFFGTEIQVDLKVSEILPKLF